MAGLAERLYSSLRGAWGEHGAWVVSLVSATAGLIMARSLDPAALLLLPAVALITAAKGLTTAHRRTGRGFFPAMLFAAAGATCAIPAALAVPWACGALAIAALPFAAFFLFADSPRWSRSLTVEVLGTFLLATASGLPIVVARRGAYTEALCAWVFFGLMFLPGVLRVRIPKSHQVSLQVACTLAAAASLALLVAYVVVGKTAWWSLAAAPPVVKEAYRAWVLPGWSTRELGLNLTLKAVFVALVVSIAWQPGALS